MVKDTIETIEDLINSNTKDKAEERKKRKKKRPIAENYGGLLLNLDKISVR
jgi:hypothetical protein